MISVKLFANAIKHVRFWQTNRVFQRSVSSVKIEFVTFREQVSHVHFFLFNTDYSKMSNAKIFVSYIVFENDL